LECALSQSGICSDRAAKGFEIARALYSSKFSTSLLQALLDSQAGDLGLVDTLASESLKTIDVLSPELSINSDL
jgi:hypothetical protein